MKIELEFPIETNLASPTLSALFSVNMLINTSGGRCYAAQEMIQWLTKSGFRKCGKKMLDATVLVFGSA
jgi:hypothetical protein